MTLNQEDPSGLLPGACLSQPGPSFAFTPQQTPLCFLPGPTSHCCPHLTILFQPPSPPCTCHPSPHKPSQTDTHTHTHTHTHTLHHTHVSSTSRALLLLAPLLRGPSSPPLPGKQAGSLLHGIGGPGMLLQPWGLPTSDSAQTPTTLARNSSNAPLGPRSQAQDLAPRNSVPVARSPRDRG